MKKEDSLKNDSGWNGLAGSIPARSQIKNTIMPTKREIQYEIQPDGCWHCVSHTCHTDGYPVMTRNRKLIYLHRYMYELHAGKIQEGMVVRHKCDNPKCINPGHLELGTHQDNVNDRVERDRSAKGSKNGCSKLTDEQAKEIKLDKTTATRFLALKYGVSKCTIRDIRNGRRWRDL